MRIIRGKYGHRRFQVPALFSARPTTDFAKENLFNVLDNLIDWDDLIALDLFSGTGSISFELLSRGCRSVTAVESNYAHASFIAKVAAELKEDKLTLYRQDVFRYLHSAKKQAFDFVFADPPYDLKELPELPQLIVDGNILRDGGIFVLEHSKTNDFSNHPDFYQRRIYGSVNFSLFIKGGAKTNA
ncbi:MAG: 16S rRNA (guanine(966)-N(2))-methyltransferase RsmD [Tannerella sp.]|jgi:16S rRNA (guanine(966)-N(2))-methyltransferase RsmD|nr:16S rRNA (guanine(966)-N(2))-methyltransferase RsmD [Tannerella sp.]